MNVYTSFAWRHAWEYGLGLRTVLLARSITSGGDTPEQASAVVQPMLDELNDKLDFFLECVFLPKRSVPLPDLLPSRV